MRASAPRQKPAQSDESGPDRRVQGDAAVAGVAGSRARDAAQWSRSPWTVFAGGRGPRLCQTEAL